MSNLATLETCLIITPLAFFLRKLIVSLFLGVSISSLILYLASYNSVAVSIIFNITRFLYISYRGLEVPLLLVTAFLKPIINARS